MPRPGGITRRECEVRGVPVCPRCTELAYHQRTLKRLRELVGRQARWQPWIRDLRVRIRKLQQLSCSAPTASEMDKSQIEEARKLVDDIFSGPGMPHA